MDLIDPFFRQKFVSSSPLEGGNGGQVLLYHLKVTSDKEFTSLFIIVLARKKQVPLELVIP